jgi:1,4-dihydroxy-2-naphthoate octaprenyltransferase
MRFFSPVLLLVLVAIPPAQAAIGRLSQPRPGEPPPGYPIWPRWFSTVCFVHNRVFSNYFVLALVIDTLIRTFIPSFWR